MEGKYQTFLGHWGEPVQGLEAHLLTNATLPL